MENPPPEGLLNLRQARVALQQTPIGSSHIREAIILSHASVEALFRGYLSRGKGIPHDIAGDASIPHKLRFPELIGAMISCATPALKNMESDLRTLNTVRNQHAHGAAGPVATKSQADACLKTAEAVYVLYWPGLKFESVNVKERSVMNPFIQDRQKARTLAKYESDANRRVVWVKGGRAKVAPMDNYRCPIFEFDTVVFVWMHDAELAFDFSSTRFLSDDGVEVCANVSMTAAVRDSEAAIVTVVTRYDESLTALQNDLAAHIRDFCRNRSSAEIIKAETLLSNAIKETHAGTATGPFLIKKVRVGLSVPLLEQAVAIDTQVTFAHEREKRAEEQEAALARIRAVRSAEELNRLLKEEKQRLDAEQERELARAQTAQQKELARLSYLNQITELTDRSRTAILHIDKDVFRDLELAKLASSDNQRDAARNEVLTMLKALSEVVKNTNPNSPPPPH